jgi:hypothetical protein
VRSLAADLGTALGGGAHLRDLRRHAVGPYGLDEAAALEDLAPERLLPPVEALRGRPGVTVDGDVLGYVRHGRVLPADVLGVPAPPAAPAGPPPSAAAPGDGGPGDGGPGHGGPGHGGPAEARGAGDDGPWAVTDPAGALLAVYVRHTGDTLKPAVVLAR